tara:strand:- start:189 stop:404 length:216 start_codon:yes stop_codon:yes gene_type:complete
MLYQTERYSVLLKDIEFITWKQNDEDGSFWAKFHMPSGKYLRERFKTKEERNEFIELWNKYRKVNKNELEY